MSQTKEDLIPPGWSYNPASWSQRIPIVILAIIGLGIASYLALYQLRVFPTVWDPFFGDGSKTILNSSVSNVLPIPDAALGALGYLVDALTGVIGGKHRWKTMPWIVVIFGMAVGPLGFVSVMLVVFQPVLFAAWCTLCLCSAVISIAMIGPAMDEMLASLQFLQRARRAEVSTWKVFWGVDSETAKVK
ncbi:MAG: vitamin K epoxide reductase family protein [Salinimicrobium sp.]